MTMFSIYIHIPFCLKKCAYCDFHSIAVESDDVPQKEYAAAVCAELEKQVALHNLRSKKVESIYFGGGTPTLLDVEHLELILNSIRRHFTVDDNAEITIEANPETLSSLSPRGRGSGVRGLLNAGFNRISIGVQTFNDAHLKKLGRIHSAETAKKVIRGALGANFKNISIDLMWGLPEQTINEVETDIGETLKFGVQHISAYQLTLDEDLKGPCKRWKLPDDELSRRMWLTVHNKLTAAGYEHYEISNFAQRGRQCLHNLNYWRYGTWLGLGSGAVSFINDRSSRIRLTANKNIEKYLRHDFLYEEEIIDTKTAVTEYSFLALRTSEGINIDEFNAAYPHLSHEWIKNGLAQLAGKRLFLTTEGMLISNELFSRL